jgi:hypothetical protein
MFLNNLIEHNYLLHLYKSIYKNNYNDKQIHAKVQKYLIAILFWKYLIR